MQIRSSMYQHTRRRIADSDLASSYTPYCLSFPYASTAWYHNARCQYRVFCTTGTNCTAKKGSTSAVQSLWQYNLRTCTKAFCTWIVKVVSSPDIPSEDPEPTMWQNGGWTTDATLYHRSDVSTISVPHGFVPTLKYKTRQYKSSFAAYSIVLAVSPVENANGDPLIAVLVAAYARISTVLATAVRVGA